MTDRGRRSIILRLLTRAKHARQRERVKQEGRSRIDLGSCTFEGPAIKLSALDPGLPPFDDKEERF